MLRERAARLAAGDVEGYLRPLSPEARASEEPVARGAVAAPLAGIELTLDGRATSGPDGRDFRGARIDLTYRYRDLPADNFFRLNFVSDLQKVGRDWTVTASRVAQSVDLPPWATGQVEVARTEHFLALARPLPGDPAVGRALEIAERARRDLLPRLTFEPERAHLVVLARNRAEYEQLAAGRAPVSPIAQAETAFEFTPGSIRVHGRQMLVNLEELFGRRSPDEILQHELAHLALAPLTRPFTPAWIAEAAAMYLAGSRPLATWQSGRRQGRFDVISFVELGRLANLGQHDPSGETASLQYAYSAAAAWYLTEAFGPERFWSLYRAFAEVPAADVYAEITASGLSPTLTPGATDPRLTELGARTAHDALVRVYGFDETELDRRVREWIAAA